MSTSHKSGFVLDFQSANNQLMKFNGFLFFSKICSL